MNTRSPKSVSAFVTLLKKCIIEENAIIEVLKNSPVNVCCAFCANPNLDKRIEKQNRRLQWLAKLAKKHNRNYLANIIDNDKFIEYARKHCNVEGSGGSIYSDMLFVWKYLLW